MFTAILFAIDPGGTGQTFTLSREVPNDDKAAIYTYMKAEGETTDDAIDTILLVRNGIYHGAVNPPEVFHHWTAENGDFVGL